MAKEDLTYKDLSKGQLENLKQKYIETRISSMSEQSLRDYVRTIITDQITGTVGNEEEREAWKEMKEFFEDDFEKIIKEVLQINSPSDETISPEQQELERRLDLLEKRKKEKKENSNEDMW